MALSPRRRRLHKARLKSRAKLRRWVPRACVVCIHWTGDNKHRHARFIGCHHVDGNPLNDELENLVWLCNHCHDRYHSSKTSGHVRRRMNIAIQKHLETRNARFAWLQKLSP